jgi:4-oxalocrotonate tautomerase
MPLVQITIVEGRSPEQKKVLAEKVTDAVQESIGAPRQAIRVAIYELPAAHWFIAGAPIK